MKKSPLPPKTVYRLALYLHCLERVPEPVVSSEILAAQACVKPTQLRKDLALCGASGKRGSGYRTKALRLHLTKTLGIGSLQPVALVGTGPMGRALVQFHESFRRRGFEIAAAFDERRRPAATLSTTPVFPMARLPEVVRDRKFKIALLCVPARAAQETCNALIASGILAILNFAPVALQVPERIAVKNVNLAMELENLSYFLR